MRIPLQKWDEFSSMQFFLRWNQYAGMTVPGDYFICTGEVSSV